MNSSSSLRSRCWRLTLLVLLAACPACAHQRTVLDDSVVDTYGGPDQDLDFWDEIATRPTVTVNDVLHGLLLLSHGEDPADDYAGRLFLAHHGWMRMHEKPPANQSATVGLISFALCDMLEIEGGLVMGLFGPTPRHCARELVYLGIMPDRTVNQTLTGLEFVDLIRRVADRMTPPEDDAMATEAGDQ